MSWLPEIYFLIRPNWKNLNREIWNSLEKSESAPLDMYIELLRFAHEKLGIDPNIEALNSPELARDEFRKFQVPLDELSCISILEGFHEVLSEFSTDIAKKYRLKLSQFLAEHNLRYHLTPDCKFELSIQGLLMTQCTHLYKSVVNHQDRIECIEELQASLSRLRNRGEERNCIRIASNLLEGLTIDRSGNRANALGNAIDCCPSDIFPHKSLKECVKNLYKFWSDYPNIRHAGTPTSRVRDLKKDDALLIIALTLGFASFISNDNASEEILTGNL